MAVKMWLHNPKGRVTMVRNREEEAGVSESRRSLSSSPFINWGVDAENCGNQSLLSFILFYFTFLKWKVQILYSLLISTIVYTCVFRGPKYYL